MNPASQYGGHAYYFLLAVLQEKQIENNGPTIYATEN